MKGGPIARILLAILFVAMVASPLIIKRMASQRDAAKSKLDAQTALARHGFYLQEVSHAAGVNFVHQAPTLDHKLDHIMPQVASMGASVSIVDFDQRRMAGHLRDQQRGRQPERAVPQSCTTARLKMSPKKWASRDVNEPGTGVSMGAVWGDYDNDGYEDLLLVKWGRPELFHNDGGNGFTRVTEAAGLPKWVNANTAIWFDYDGDGLLDLFHRRLLLRGYRSVASGEHAHDAGQF